MCGCCLRFSGWTWRQKCWNWYATIASLPVLPAPGSTTNLGFSTLICHASLAELTKLTSISSFWLPLIYQLIDNVSEKAGSVLPVSPKGNGNKSLTLDTFPLFLELTLLYLFILQIVNLQYIDFPSINRSLSNILLQPNRGKRLRLL